METETSKVKLVPPQLAWVLVLVSKLRLLQLVDVLDMVPLDFVLELVLGSCTRLTRCPRSSHTSGFTRIDTAVSASFTLRLKIRCCGDVRFSQLALFRELRGQSTAYCFICCCWYHSLFLTVFHSFVSSLWISESAVLELRCRVSRLFRCSSFSAFSSPPDSSRPALLWEPTAICPSCGGVTMVCTIA